MQQTLIIRLTPEELIEAVRKVFQEEVGGMLRSGPVKEEDQHLYTVQETAALLSITRQTVHQYVRVGKLPVHKIGARSYFMRAEILAALQREGYQRTIKSGKGNRRA